MSEFEDKLHAILSDPEEMERISRLAAGLMGGGAANSGEAPDGAGALLGRLGAMLGASAGGEKAQLLNGLSPYLRADRRARLSRALTVAGVLAAAGAALREEGKPPDV